MKKNFCTLALLCLSNFVYSETLFIKQVDSDFLLLGSTQFVKPKKPHLKRSDFSFLANDNVVVGREAIDFVFERQSAAKEYLKNIGPDRSVWLGPRISKTISEKKNHKDVSLLRATILHLYPEYNVKLFPQNVSNWQENVVDDDLLFVVKDLQKRWGLNVDGIVSKQFYFNLYLTNKERTEIANNYIKALEEIITELKSSNQKRIVLVNVSSFNLIALGGGEIIESSVIVGSPSRRTPIGKMKILGLKLNPDWTPPPGIMSKDVLPAIEQGRLSVLRKKGLVVTDSSGENISIEELSGMSKSEIFEMGLRFRQPAGDSNALGVLKFETDSKENIYLHDTNDRKLFELSHRALSSGCIRVKEWQALASWSSMQSEDWIQVALSQGMTKIIKINNPIDVHVINEQLDYINGNWVFYPKVY